MSIHEALTEAKRSKRAEYLRNYRAKQRLDTPGKLRGAAGRAALARRVEMRRLRQVLEVGEEDASPRQRRLGEQRYAASRREQRLEQLRSLGWRCPVCSKVELNSRLWVFPLREVERQAWSERKRFHLRQMRPLCKRCHMAAQGVREGRPRLPDPPASMVCSGCKRHKPHRHQWDLKVGTCRQCSARAAELAEHERRLAVAVQMAAEAADESDRERLLTHAAMLEKRLADRRAKIVGSA